jgi:hypothetical protein
MVPSFFMPIFTSIDEDDVGPVARSTSSRLITILTGRLALSDRASATGSMNTVVLPPKPPPISEAVTRRFDTSMPSRPAQVLRTMKWPWVHTHISPRPSAPIEATQACGSI